MTATSLEQFIERTKSGKNVSEDPITTAAVNADKQLAEQKIKLISHLTVKKVGEEVVPVFDSGVMGVLKPLAAAEEKASGVKKDIDRYLFLLQDAPSITVLVDETNHLKIKIRNAEATAKGELERAIRAGKDQNAANVIDAQAKALRIRTECQTQVDSLLARISEARQILDSY